MQHFEYQEKAFGDLTTAYPHSPEDIQQSVRDYLEDMYAQGYEYQAHSWYSTAFMQFVFKVVAK